uniref:Uncharacterized protein n=1 Tax=Arundo donax TaxID=35708 RepID=A0A0A9E8P6_ARUDO
MDTHSIMQYEHDRQKKKKKIMHREREEMKRIDKLKK